MSTLKMVLPVEITLEITIQKNLPKPQKFARKIIGVESRYSQTIFSAVHSNFTYDPDAYDLLKIYMNFT